MQTVTELINNYGYIVLFCVLALELVALPLPGETTMTYCGFLVYESKMNYLFSILTATSGIILGITISYFLGRKLGEEFFSKYGSYVHFGPDKLEKTSKWFNDYGDRLLLFAYFIPGVRHITGYFSGITQISFKKFALYAYSGALIWAATFISLGKLLGENWSEFHSYLNKYIVPIIIVVLVIFVLIYIYKYHKSTVKLINKILNKLNSKKKLKIIITSITVGLLGFFVLLIGIIQGII